MEGEMKRKGKGVIEWYGGVKTMKRRPWSTFVIH